LFTWAVPEQNNREQCKEGRAPRPPEGGDPPGRRTDSGEDGRDARRPGAGDDERDGSRRPVHHDLRHRALEPGQYTDSILPNQERWYAVDVAEGQTLDAAVTLVGQDRSARFGVGSVRGAIVTPDGDEANQDFSDRAGGIDNVTLNMSSGVVGQTLFADRGGTYYVSVSFESDNQALSQTEFPLEVIVKIVGDAVQPTPTETSDERVDEGDEPGGGGSAEGPSPDAGGDAMTGVAGSILFLVAGLVLGMVATRKLRGGARA
jgi:hypothetical protein